MPLQREDVRDIFADKERARTYEENKAEIIGEIKKNVIQNKNNMSESTSKTDQLLEMMRGIKAQNAEMKAQNESMQREINELKEQLLGQQGKMY